MNLTDFQGITLIIPGVSPVLTTLLCSACADKQLRFMTLTADTPRARALATQLAGQDICHTAAVCGGQLAAALEAKQIALPAMCLLPDAGAGCRLPQASGAITALLRELQLPLVPVREATQLLRRIDGLLTSPGLMVRTVSAVCLADSLTLLTAQAKARAADPTAVDALCNHWTAQLAASLPGSPIRLRAAMQRTWQPMLADFCALAPKPNAPTLLGIGGESFLRMSAALNCGLADAVSRLGFAPVFGGLSDDLLTRLQSFPQQHPNARRATLLALRTAQGYLAELRADWCNAVNESGCFVAPLPAPSANTPFAGTAAAMAQCGVAELIYLRTEHCTVARRPNILHLRETFPSLRLSALTIPANCTPVLLDKKLRILFPDRTPEPTA